MPANTSIANIKKTTDLALFICMKFRASYDAAVSRMTDAILLPAPSRSVSTYP